MGEVVKVNLMFWKTKEVKYCEDCKWFVKADKVTNYDFSYDVHSYSKCSYPEFSLVNKQFVKDKFCESQRLFANKNTCGPEGKWYEPKSS